MDEWARQSRDRAGWFRQLREREQEQEREQKLGGRRRSRRDREDVLSEEVW